LEEAYKENIRLEAESAALQREEEQQKRQENWERQRQDKEQKQRQEKEQRLRQEEEKEKAITQDERLIHVMQLLKLFNSSPGDAQSKVEQTAKQQNSKLGARLDDDVVRKMKKNPPANFITNWDRKFIREDLENVIE
jgi:hypothetical protein